MVLLHTSGTYGTRAAMTDYQSIIFLINFIVQSIKCQKIVTFNQKLQYFFYFHGVIYGLGNDLQ